MTAYAEHINGFAPAAPVVVAEPAQDSDAVPPIQGTLKTAVKAVGFAVAALGLLGFVNSFHRVDTTAQPSFHSLAWTVPTGIDLGIFIFSAADIVLAILKMRIFWLRLIPWALTWVTIDLNIANQAGQPPLSGFDKLAHGVLPALWAISVEVGAHVVRKRARLTDKKRIDRVRISRWLLAPLPTLGLWRRMVLWEERSYPVALEREKTRLLAKTDLQDTYGLLWRWRAPRRQRALFRLGALAPTPVAAALTQPGTDSPESLESAESPQASHSESAATALAESPVPMELSGVSQPTNLLTPGHPVFAEVVASLPPVTRPAARPRRTAAASVPARKAASVSARVGVDRDSAEQFYRDSLTQGAPLSSRELADSCGVSQSTANRIIAKVRKEVA